MQKNYLIASAVIVIILAVGIYFQIQDNKKLNENMPMVGNQNIEENQNRELITEILQEGIGPEAKEGDQVSVNYVGTLEDGTVFDSNNSTTSPFTFVLGAGQVIQGWDQGVLEMKVGEKRRLTIPANLAYGAIGSPGVIPANATLIFEVDLLGIN